MKQIIIFLLIIIVAIIGFGQYKKYKRFSLSEYEYKTPDTIDIANVDKGLLLDYYEAVEALNGCVITQWGAEEIDVRNPKGDSEQELAAVAKYRKKLANVRFYEAQLLNPSGKESTRKVFSEDERKKESIRAAYQIHPDMNSFEIGDSSALIFEIQRLLNEKGDSILRDGIYKEETLNSLQAFEKKNGLFPDGRMDAITLEYLLK